MIYSIFNNLSRSAKKFWQCWSLEGLSFMVSLTIPNENLIERLSRQSEAWRDFLGKPYYLAPKTSTRYSSKVAEISEIDNETHSSTSDKEIELAQSISFAEIFHLTLPLSPKIIEFNILIEDIWASRQDNSLINRDDTKVIKAVLLISDILDIYWNEFPTKFKILLLERLKLWNKPGWSFILSLIPEFAKSNKTNSERNKSYALEYTSLDKSTQDIILKRFVDNFIPSLKAFFTIWKTTRKVFNQDTLLFKENQENIQDIITDIKNSAQKEVNSKLYAIKMTQEDITERAASFDRFREYKRQLWNNATSEEQAESDRQFEHLSKLLKDARDIKS